MRINARLDPERSRKLEFLKRRSQAGTSEVVKRGIDAYYDEVKKEGLSPYEILTASGFIGCAEGPEDLSVNYKEELTKSLAAKHGYR